MTYDWGGAIQELRWKADLTQRQLAAKSEVTIQALSNIESGRQAGMNTDTLERIAGALNVTVAEIATKAMALEAVRQNLHQPVLPENKQKEE
jgi:transcriptional regulator with XRE-family HTH domain